MAKLERTYNTISYLKYFPEHWEVVRIKNVFEEIDERSEDGTEELLSVSHYTGVTLKRDSLENEDDFLTNAKTLEGYKKVTKGDLVSNIMLAWNGSMGISPYDGITSPAYCVYRIKNGYNPYYFGYLFGTNLMKTEFRKKSTGIIDSRLRLYSDKFFSIFTVTPPIEEQNKIVAFIEAKTVVINHFISQKQKFITLLKEQRQSIINEAVTKGIDKRVKLKHSGINWLGEIPEHWKVRRLASLGAFSKGGNVSKADLTEDGKYPVILYGDIYTKYEFSVINILNKIDTNVADNASKIYNGDLLFTGSGEDKGDIGKCIVYLGKAEAYAGGDIIIFRQNIFLPEFISYSQSSVNAKYQKYITSKGDIIVHTYSSKLREIKMPFPPTIEEQEKIIHHIKSETRKIDCTISKAEKEIELIKEYKEAMIAEAVMGKINITKAKATQHITTKKEANWEFKEAVLISVLTDKFGSVQYPLGRKRYTKYSYLFHRHTDNKTEGYLKKAAGPYNPKTRYGGPEKIALQNKYVAEVKSGNLSGFVASDKIEEAKNYFGNYWSIESLNWLEQLRYKKNDELELYATVDKAMGELAESNKDINLQSVKQIIDKHPEWKPKLERNIFSDYNIAKAMEFLKQLFQ